MSSTMMSLPRLDDDGGLSQYLQRIKLFPMLKADEEYMLATRWQQHQDINAAHQLVTSHLRLVPAIAMRFRGYGLPMSDIIAEGNLGLMTAVKKFDPEKGFRLTTYAIWWIKAAIQEYILHSWSLVKIGTTSSQKKLFFNLRRLKGKLNAIEENDLSPEQAQSIARDLKVSAAEVMAMNGRLVNDQSLNTRLGGENQDLELQDLLVDQRPTAEAALVDSDQLEQRTDALHQAIATLPEREQAILKQRRLLDTPKTLDELSQLHGISRERVRQLENKAMDKITRLLSTHKST